MANRDIMRVFFKVDDETWKGDVLHYQVDPEDDEKVHMVVRIVWPPNVTRPIIVINNDEVFEVQDDAL